KRLTKEGQLLKVSFRFSFGELMKFQTRAKYIKKSPISLEINIYFFFFFLIPSKTIPKIPGKHKRKYCLKKSPKRKLIIQNRQSLGPHKIIEQ
ncbi:MAG: hypothetical protein EAZ41_09260, partial [Sphingobacteriia bacterium]